MTSQAPEKRNGAIVAVTRVAEDLERRARSRLKSAMNRAARAPPSRRAQTRPGAEGRCRPVGEPLQVGRIGRLAGDVKNDRPRRSQPAQVGIEGVGKPAGMIEHEQVGRGQGVSIVALGIEPDHTRRGPIAHRRFVRGGKQCTLEVVARRRARRRPPRA